MVYFFVNKDGSESCSNECPERNFDEWIEWKSVFGEECHITTLPKGTIKKIIGKELTWENNPYKYYGIEEIDNKNNI